MPICALLEVLQASYREHAQQALSIRGYLLAKGFLKQLDL